MHRLGKHSRLYHIRQQELCKYVFLLNKTFVEYFKKTSEKQVVAYSLHSNFEELELFMRSIYPGVLKTVVKNKNTAEKINNISQFSAYMTTLMHLK